MAASEIFKDFDDQAVLDDILARSVDPRARNFVVEFGPGKAQIAFDLSQEKFEGLMQHNDPPRDPERPVRWINIWGPNLQVGIMKAIGARYGFSRRFQAILESSPRDGKTDHSHQTGDSQHGNTEALKKDELNQANGAAHNSTLPGKPKSLEEANHYRIAESMLNYQSLDLGDKFLCIGANFVYHGTSTRLWSWFALCDDNTVLSFHEENTDLRYMKEIRDHTLNALKQLSAKGLPDSGSMSMISVRELLKIDVQEADHGMDGSSNLFYYLFDNWHGTYLLIIEIQKRLQIISHEILDGLNLKHQRSPSKNIIPDLYKIGKELRKNQHLYEGYENIIERILAYRAGGNSHRGKRVVVALSASERFERLGDRIKLLVLSSIKEAIAEQNALLTTHFNITAQNDSAATAKLSRNAALLSKLGVLFLPVSLMTSYFSVQIADLQGVYTSNTYWISFAVIIVASFVALFFLSRALVTVSESLELWARGISARFTRYWVKVRPRWMGRRRAGGDVGGNAGMEEIEGGEKVS